MMNYDSYALSGVSLSLWWALPFLGIILSIAFIPLLKPHFWKLHFGKVTYFWIVMVLGGIGIMKGPLIGLHCLTEVIVEQYLPFIMLIVTLYVITGGIRFRGQLIGTPMVNLAILMIGAILSSWLGTTGAAILLIRPLINANLWRSAKTHTLIFFIFIVGNIGGSLTPIGNPPLLMGFISKVPFFWPTSKLFLPTAVCLAILLILYFMLDTYNFKKENVKQIIKDDKPLVIEGAWNFFLLAGVILMVILSNHNLGTVLIVFQVPIPLSELIELGLLLFVAFLSLKFTRKEIRLANNFHWHPIVEVGKLFAGIFICMIPLMAMLKVGGDGPLKFMIHSLSMPDGHPNTGMYFWLTGGFSAFLDSAPAYLVVFNYAASPSTALGMAPSFYMTHVIPSTLIAITAGASFMGALTYIGNAPNMMVYAIAEEYDIQMPSFFGYMGWSVGILIPVFILVHNVFI